MSQTSRKYLREFHFLAEEFMKAANKIYCSGECEAKATVTLDDGRVAPFVYLAVSAVVEDSVSISDVFDEWKTKFSEYAIKKKGPIFWRRHPRIDLVADNTYRISARLYMEEKAGILWSPAEGFPFAVVGWDCDNEKDAWESFAKEAERSFKWINGKKIWRRVPRCYSEKRLDEEREIFVVKARVVSFEELPDGCSEVFADGPYKEEIDHYVGTIGNIGVKQWKSKRKD